MTRPFRFGVSVWSADSRADWQAKARKAEALGYDVLCVPDHLMPGVLSPISSLCTAVEATRTLRVGTLVLNNDLRHPALVARDAATIDRLSDGRLELGIGAGHMQGELASIGLAFDEAAVRIARLSEAVCVLKRLLAGETVDFRGEHYVLRAHAAFSPAVQRPVPLLIGGNGRAVLELAAREAAVVGFTGFFPTDGGSSVDARHFDADGFSSRLSIVQAAAGERLADLELHALIQAVVVADSARGAAERVQRRMPGLAVERMLDSPFLLLGTHDVMVDALLERRERFGLSYFTVFEGAIDAFAPVVARLKGR